MNSSDPLFLNYMALYLCICKEFSSGQALSAMRLNIYERNPDEKEDGKK